MITPMLAGYLAHTKRELQKRIAAIEDQINEAHETGDPDAVAVLRMMVAENERRLDEILTAEMGC